MTKTRTQAAARNATPEREVYINVILNELLIYKIKLSRISC